MKTAIATNDYSAVCGHAGQPRHSLLYDRSQYVAGALLPAPHFVDLAPEQVLHHFRDGGPHPLDGVDIVVSVSAGDGFIRHMKQRGTEVLLTGEGDPAVAITRIVAVEALSDPRFDITTTLCKLRDIFSRH